MLMWPDLVRHLPGNLIVDFVSEAKKTEPVLLKTALLCEQFIVNTMKDLDHINFTIRREIMKQAIDPKQKHLSSLQNRETVTKYASLYTRILNSIIRTITDSNFSMFPPMRSPLKVAVLEYIDSLSLADENQHMDKFVVTSRLKGDECLVNNVCIVNVPLTFTKILNVIIDVA